MSQQLSATATIPNEQRDNPPALLSELRLKAACREITTGVKAFTLVETTFDGGIKIQTWQSGDIVATVTRFENTMCMVKMTDGSRHVNTTGNFADGHWLAFVWSKEVA